MRVCAGVVSQHGQRRLTLTLLRVCIGHGRVQDIPTIVIDVGSNTIKAGFAGEEAPLVMASAVAGHVRSVHLMDIEKHAHVNKDVYVGDEVWAYKDALNIRRVVAKGVVQHWDDFELLLRQILFEEMKLPEDLSQSVNHK